MFILAKLFFCGIFIAMKGGCSMADGIGERLRMCRRKRGLSLRGLAETSQVPVSTISAVEAGARPGAGISMETAKKLSVALQMSLDWLAFGYERSTPPP
jgi:transcriptional regulator with XRE-family HTH domain